MYSRSPEALEDSATNWYKRASNDGDHPYRGYHRAPTGEHGEGSLSNMTLTYPDDVYSKDGWRFYGGGSSTMAMDKKAHEIIVRVKGNPGAKVKVYRAVPKGSEGKINPGDWVTTVREYAEGHGEGIREGFKVVEAEVRAGDLFTEGNSLLEYGWRPQP